MSEESDATEASAEEAHWVIEPPGPGQVELLVSLGEGVELSADARTALETLIADLQGAEVGGYGYDPDCSVFRCKLSDCQPVTRLPCRNYYRCRIEELTMM